MKRIEDYALIGDGETAALVGSDGSIDWLCMPRFDSAACFAALLGDAENGCWRMAPEQTVVSRSRRYEGDTLILETLFETAEGCAAVIDFMPLRGNAPDIVRIVEGRRGKVAMRSDLALRFDFGQLHPFVQSRPDGPVVAIAGPNGIMLAFDTPIDFGERWFRSRFTIAEGERRHFVLTWFPAGAQLPEKIDPERALAETRSRWRQWVGGSAYSGPHRDLVVRSLITLKALIHEPGGAIVAAPTTSLPESPGGGRNWDYRFCWLRDSTFILITLLQAGMRKEAAAWVGWLRRAVAGEPIDLQPLYTVGGDRLIVEWEVEWLAGFNGARPVRVGNAATKQRQLDIYGEVIETLSIATRHGLEHESEIDRLMRLLAGRLAAIWDRPDAGIWEMRAEPRHFVYSKAMCWKAFDCAARWFAGKDAPLQAHYAELASRVKEQILERGFDAAKNSFVSHYGSGFLDAAALRLPLIGFLPATDPRIVGTVDAIERELVRDDGLVRRYRTEHTDDGRREGEGAFLAASFWLADVYALQDRTADARALFRKLCGFVNDVGLLAEEQGANGMLGNFPQGLSHLSLVTTAMNLSQIRGPARERGEKPSTA